MSVTAKQHPPLHRNRVISHCWETSLPWGPLPRKLTPSVMHLQCRGGDPTPSGPHPRDLHVISSRRLSLALGLGGLPTACSQDIPSLLVL